MSDTPNSSAAAAAPAAAGASTPSRDQGPKEEKLAMSQPAADVEMEDLSGTDPKPANPESTPTQTSSDKKTEASDVASPPSAPDQAPTDASPSAPGAPETPSSPIKDTTTTPGDEQDLTIESATGESPESALAVDIMLLLTSGARHPFRIDEKYLTKRNVTVTGKTESGVLDPFSITVYTLKELILRDWRKEWDQPPREPSAIRLIHFGRMLEDRMALSHYQFSSSSRNVIHMTVKPQDIIDEEEAAKKVKESGSERGRRGCCVIL